MRLVSLTVRNYRIHQDKTVHFDPALTVIGGPNESGKSTIVEAVHHALFLRSRIGGTVLESMQSQWHPGHPTVELTLESDGSTYTITKQFTGGASAVTTLARAGHDMLRGEEAEEAIHRILEADDVGGGQGVAKRLRLQWAHLWVWQGTAGDDPLPRSNDQATATRLRERLGRIDGGSVLESPLDGTVAQQILDQHAGRTRDDGLPRSGSPLASATTELAAAAAALEAAETTVETLHAAVADVDATTATIADCESSLTSTRTEQERLRARQSEVSQLSIQLAQQEMAADTAATDLHGLVAANAEIVACEQGIAAIADRMMPATEQLAETKEAEKSGNARFAAAMKSVSGMQKKQAASAGLVELHGLCEELERRKTDREGLGGRCRKIAELRNEQAAIRGELAALPAVSAEDLAALTKLERSLDGAQATLEAIATRIELIATDCRVVLADRELSVNAGETITAEAELVIGDAVRLRILPGGGRTLTAATQHRDETHATLAVRLSALGIESVDDARRIQPQRQSLAADLAGKQTAIENLGGEKADRDLQLLEESIAVLEGDIARRAPDGFVRPVGLDAALCRKHEIDEESRLLGDTAAAASAELEAAGRLHTEAVEARVQAEESIRKSDDELRTRQGRLGVLVEKHGGDRQERIRQLETTSSVATVRLTAMRTRLAELQPELIDLEATRLERALEKHADRRRAAETTRQFALARLTSEGTSDPREDRARAVARTRRAESCHQQASRKAGALQLLSTLFTEKKREVESQFVGPLTNRVAEYLRCLYGADTQVSVEYRDGMFQNLTLARPGFGNSPFHFSQLSGGSREQVSAAYRLAMAEILAEGHDGCLPVVFDDAFVNSDPARIRGLQGLLDLAASRGLQVIVLACNPNDYGTLGAETIEFSKLDLAGLSARKTSTASP